MTIDGGGWTQLVSPFATTLTGNATKRYLYVLGGHWYESPTTALNWMWTAGQELTGTYAYFNGASMGSFPCTGSAEQPQFGVGCSNGGGPTFKVLPIYTDDSAAGMCEVCQDQPDAFGVGACTPPQAASVFVR